MAPRAPRKCLARQSSWVSSEFRSGSTSERSNRATCGEEEKERAKETGHSTAREAAQVALAAKARRLVLSHVSARYSISADELVKEAREVFKETVVAKDGMTIEVPFAD